MTLINVRKYLTLALPSKMSSFSCLLCPLPFVVKMKNMCFEEPLLTPLNITNGYLNARCLGGALTCQPVITSNVSVSPCEKSPMKGSKNTLLSLFLLAITSGQELFHKTGRWSTFTFCCFQYLRYSIVS